MNRYHYIVVNCGETFAISVLADTKLEAYKRIKAEYPDARIFVPKH